MPFTEYFPRTFSRSSIERHAPSAPGVFAISSASEWILIAESNNICESLLQHAAETSTAMRGRQPTGFVFEVCLPAFRQARYRRLLEEYRPLFTQGGHTA